MIESGVVRGVVVRVEGPRGEGRDYGWLTLLDADAAFRPVFVKCPVSLLGRFGSVDLSGLSVEEVPVFRNSFSVQGRPVVEVSVRG